MLIIKTVKVTSKLKKHNWHANTHLQTYRHIRPRTKRSLLNAHNSDNSYTFNSNYHKDDVKKSTQVYLKCAINKIDNNNNFTNNNNNIITVTGNSITNNSINTNLINSNAAAVITTNNNNKINNINNNLLVTSNTTKEMLLHGLDNIEKNSNNIIDHNNNKIFHNNNNNEVSTAAMNLLHLSAKPFKRMFKLMFL